MPRKLSLTTLFLATTTLAPAGWAQAPVPGPVTQPGEARGRADENAVRQAQDAFGTSVGRETIGLYNAALVRGFSPIAAGNARIEGLYFDQVWAPSPRMRRSSTVRVGIAALGYPFPAPTGIVDYVFRKPGDERKVSVVAGGDSYGAAFLETDAELPLAERTLSLGLGGSVTHNEYASGVDGHYRNAHLALRWNPLAGIELVPFWHRSRTRDMPTLYNATVAAYLSGSLVAFAGFTRGLEESGVAPDSAANRNELLSAIRTSQGDVGLRWTFAPDMRLVAALFEVRKPYFNFDGANRYVLLGDMTNRGVELSVAGRPVPSLSVVAGAVLSRPRANGEGVALGRIGARPVGIASRTAELSLDWRTPWREALSLDTTVSHSGALTATVDNRVAIPARTLVTVGGRYRFRLCDRPATLRIAVANLSDVYGYELKSAGAYDIIPGRLASAYLSVDF